MSLKQTMPQSLFERDPELAKLIDVLDDGLRTHRDGIERLYDAFDLLRMDDTTVEKWLKALGWKWRWPDNRRLLLKLLLNIYRWRGTREGIERAVNIIYGINISVKELWPFFYGLGRNIPDEDKNKAVIYLAPDLWKWITAIEVVTVFMKPAHAVVEVVGIPDRMLLLNQAGALVTVTQDLSWQETKTWKVFTGPRLNAAGPVEVTKIDQSWTETITHRLFTGPRLNAAGQVQVIGTSWQETITQKVFTGPRLSGSLKLNGTGRLNQAPSIEQIIPILHLAQERRFLAPVLALNSRSYLNQAPYTTSLETVRHSDIRLVRSLPSTLLKLNSAGQRLNAGQFQEIKETVTHTELIQQKKCNPELGMVLNGKPVLGYMWKKELKEVA